METTPASFFSLLPLLSIVACAPTGEAHPDLPCDDGATPTSNCLATTRGDSVGGSGWVTWTRYDDGGFSVGTESDSGADGSVDSWYARTVDAEGRSLEEEWTGGGQRSWTWFDNGWSSVTDEDGDGREDHIESQTVDGLVTTDRTDQDADGRAEYVNVVERDRSGYPVRVVSNGTLQAEYANVYNDLGRIVEQTGDGFVDTWAYDDVGNVTTWRHTQGEDGWTQRYEHDDMGRVLRNTTEIGANTYEHLYTYDEGGNETRWEYRGADGVVGAWHETDWDRLGRVLATRGACSAETVPEWSSLTTWQDAE